ncbi:MAG: hypothetical protein KKD38_00260 [Candidatus Delongbacteria bacterium]|nr:hypothetical protein [Candidatus Delongbacteria bacterium]MCG2760574.1 hypothetical protein [Candidatus Delongbacteria bacterium]
MKKTEIKNTEAKEGKVAAGNLWLALSKWAKENNKLEAWERKFVFIVGRTVNKNGEMSEKQKPIAEKILAKAKEEGFEG